MDARGNPKLKGSVTMGAIKKGIILMLVMMLLIPSLSISSAASTTDRGTPTEETPVITETVDSDGDGVPDSEDILDDGNAFVILSIDYFKLDGSADSLSAGDPFFEISIDKNGDYVMDNSGDAGVSEVYDSPVFEDTDTIDSQGYNDSGILWYGVDIPDNTTTLDMEISAWDSDVGEYQVIDLSSYADFTSLYLTYSFDSDGPLSDYGYDDGGDDGLDEIDAYIEFSIHLIKGATIESAKPDNVECSINEGESITFEIENYTMPGYPMQIGTTEYTWIYAPVVEGSSWYPLTDETIYDSYTINAPYGAAGEYYIACIVYTQAQNGEYIWNYAFWNLTIIHNNTTPTAIIDAEETSVQQFSEISFSARWSWDLDMDPLQYYWDFGDGKTGQGIDVVHAYENPGNYNVTLTVTDDEYAYDTATISVTVTPLDLSDLEEWGTLGDSGTFTLNTDYTLPASRENTKRLEAPLIDGYWLVASATFVSTTTVYHHGNATFRYSVDETKDSITINTELTGREDSYTVSYYPSLRFDISLVNVETGEWYTLWNTTTRVPIESNVDGLDADGYPYATLPVWGKGDISIYTWDNPKIIYDSNGPIVDHDGALALDTERITVADVDIIKFLEAITGAYPTAALNILDYFANMYLQANLNIDVAVKEDIGLLTRTNGELDQNEFLWYSLSSGEQHETISGRNTDSKIYGIMNAGVNSSLSASIDFYFNLTEEGQKLYAILDNIENNGLLMGAIDVAINFFSTGSLPQKDYSFTKTLWKTGELIYMENKQLYRYNYLSRTHVAINEIPTVSISKPENNSIATGIVTMEGDAADPDGSIEKIEVSVDGGPWIEALGAEYWVYQVNTSTMAPGDHVVRVRAYDGEDYSEIASLTLKIEDMASSSTEGDEDGTSMAGGDGFTIGGVNGLAVVGSIGALVALLVVVVIFLKVKKKGRREKEEPTEPEK